MECCKKSLGFVAWWFKSNPSQNYKMFGIVWGTGAGRVEEVLKVAVVVVVVVVCFI